MKKLIAGLVVGVVMGLCGCASKIDTQLTPPQEYQIENSKVFHQPYDKVWRATVESIGESFFVLENIEKHSGIMSLSFFAKEPADFIDCGTVHDNGNIFGREYSNTFKENSSSVYRKMLLVNGKPLMLIELSNFLENQILL